MTSTPAEEQHLRDLARLRRVRDCAFRDCAFRDPAGNLIRIQVLHCCTEPSG